MEEIAGEIAEHDADLRDTKEGTILISDGPPFLMTRLAACRLLIAVNTERLSADAAVYVADCIVASQDIDFADQPTRDAVFFLEDDSARFIEGRGNLWMSEEFSQVLASLD